MTGGSKKKSKGAFELWRDRAFSVLVPLLLGYLLINEHHNNQIKIILIILLVGFATGQAATFLRHIANGVSAGILKATEKDEDDVQENKSKHNKNSTKPS